MVGSVELRMESLNMIGAGPTETSLWRPDLSAALGSHMRPSNADRSQSDFANQAFLQVTKTMLVLPFDGTFTQPSVGPG